MTLQEVSEKYGYSIGYLKDHFKDAQKTILKRNGINLIKEGRGASAVYREEVMSDNRADNMFMEVEKSEKMNVMKNDLTLSNFTFCVFMGVLTTPMFVFRGTHKDFLRYIQVSDSEENRGKLDRAIEDLIGDGVIVVYRDHSTDEEVLTLTLVRKAENDMKIGMEMLVDCKLLSSKHKKKDWIPILKTWIGTELLSREESYTRQDLMNMTGLSKYLIDDSIKILRESNIFTSSRAFTAWNRCVGIKTTMNHEGFYEI